MGTEIKKFLEDNVKTKEALAVLLWAVREHAEGKFKETGDCKWINATEPFYCLVSDYLDEFFFNEEDEEDEEYEEDAEGE